MMKIALMSDTHSYFDERFYRLFADVDEIWHAGDLGDIAVLENLRAFKPTVAVYGNIDDYKIRTELKETERFTRDGADVLMTHIGGYPGKYVPRVKAMLDANAPQIFISGHSHILKVIYDKKYNLLHLNPGACGISGFHHVRTALIFAIDNGAVKDMKVIELGPRADVKK